MNFFASISKPKGTHARKDYYYYDYDHPLLLVFRICTKLETLILALHPIPRLKKNKKHSHSHSLDFVKAD